MCKYLLTSTSHTCVSSFNLKWITICSLRFLTLFKQSLCDEREIKLVKEWNLVNTSLINNCLHFAGNPLWLSMIYLVIYQSTQIRHLNHQWGNLLGPEFCTCGFLIKSMVDILTYPWFIIYVHVISIVFYFF
jgi:hypothetical protein